MLNKKGDLGGYIKLTKRSRSFAIFIGVCLTLSLLLGGEYRVIGYIGFFSSIIFLFVFTNLTVKKDKINNMLIFLTVIVLSGCIEGILKGVPFRFAIGDTFRYFLVFFICFVTYNSGKVDFEVVLKQIRAIGARHIILSTDLGQKTGIYPDEGLEQFVTSLYDRGISEEDIKKMTSYNQRILLGKA